MDLSSLYDCLGSTVIRWINFIKAEFNHLGMPFALSDFFSSSRVLFHDSAGGANIRADSTTAADCLIYSGFVIARIPSEARAPEHSRAETITTAIPAKTFERIYADLIFFGGLLSPHQSTFLS